MTPSDAVSSVITVYFDGYNIIAICSVIGLTSQMNNCYRLMRSKNKTCHGFSEHFKFIFKFRVDNFQRKVRANVNVFHQRLIYPFIVHFSRFMEPLRF